MEEESTAIHEAGHAVADFRHGKTIGLLSIVQSACGESLGRCVSESNDTDEESAAAYVIVLLAGFAAVEVDGRGDPKEGCWSDFEEAERVLRFWNLGTLDEWKSKAVEFMSRPENQAAVSRLETELIARREIDGDLVEVLIEVADGDATEDDLARYLSIRTPRGPV